MDSTEEIEHLLAEIRDIQREHLEEYRRVTAKLMELQEASVLRQTKAISNQRAALRILIACVVLWAVWFILSAMF